MSGKLYICATPIGNLSDITLRALEVLESVDLIAAEDTRHTMKLLNRFEIKKPVTSYYEHNKVFKGEKLISDLLEGKNIALVSDAGTPLISDPGDFLLRDCIENNIEIISVPGPCAAICALTTSGISSKRFYFYGFLPAKKSERTEELKKLKNFTDTMVFYEAPHKIKATLSAMNEVFGERKITIHREMTKKFEEVLRFTIPEAVNHYEENDPKGEYVIIVEGGAEETKEDDVFSSMTICEQVDYYIEQGMNKKEAIKKCADERNLPKRDVYNTYEKQQ